MRGFRSDGKDENIATLTKERAALWEKLKKQEAYYATVREVLDYVNERVWEDENFLELMSKEEKQYREDQRHANNDE